MRLALSPTGAAAVLAAIATCFVASPARAYCRAVSASPPANYDPATSGCFGFGQDGGATGGLFPLFWRNQCVSYSFQASASKYVSLADAKRVGAEAFGVWS